MHYSRSTVLAVLAVVLLMAVAAVPACAATIGNVSSYTTSGQDVTFNIQDGSRLRVTVLSDDTIRFRFAPNGTITNNISQAVVNTTWDPVSFGTQDTGSEITITTAEVVVHVQKYPCVVTITEPGGSAILGDDPNRRIMWGSDYTRVYKTVQPGESYLGLGWRTQPLRRNGTTYVMDNEPTYSDPERFYGGVPMWYGLRLGKAYAVFFDDAGLGEIDAADESTSYMYFQNTGGQVDYYFFYGPQMSKILDRYTKLTGRPFMPPKWACGYQQCRWSYTPQSDVQRVANEFRARDIPCDAIYLDIDYMDEGKQLTFEPGAFPSPYTLCTNLHSQGYRVIANISPWLLENSPKYWEAYSAGYLIKYNGSPQRGWHDYVYFVMGAPTGWLTWVDFSNSAARAWYKTKHAPFLANGIDGIWNDLNEPDEFGTWPDTVKYSFDGQNIDHKKTCNQYCLLQTDFSYDVLQDQYPNSRPFVLSRGAYAGMQRSSAVWSGDNTSEWTNDLKRNIPMGLSMSLCGQPNNGHDIGGFYGYPDFSTKPPAELFSRWMQWGVFTPFCRAHHHGGGVQQSNPYCEPWEFGTTTEDICREFIELRYRLMPYLYSLFYQAHTTGAPIQRPTVYDFQSDATTVYQNYDFMFGPSMLVSPVYTSGTTSRVVYLPSGTGWTDWWTDAHYTGGSAITASAPVDRLPIFVRDGAIIPMGPVMQYANELPITELTLKLYPGDEPSSFTMFEDDGISWDYQSGGYALTTYTMSVQNGALTLDISDRDGNYLPDSRIYTAEVHRWATSPQCVAVDGVPLASYATLSGLMAADSGYYYDSGAGILYCRFADSGDHMVLTAGPDAISPAISGFYSAGVSASGEITVRAMCSDSESGMDRVEFFVGGAWQQTITGDHPSGYDFNWTPPGADAYTLSVTAYDQAGNSSSAQLPLSCVSSIADAKSLPDGSQVCVLDGKPVTAVFASGDPAMSGRYVYVEEPLRFSGIRVRTNDASVAKGDAVLVVGVVETVTFSSKSQAEKYIDCTVSSGSIAVDGTASVPGALALSGRSIESINRGLLVTIWGTVAASGSCGGYPYIHVDDGSPTAAGHDLLAPAGSTETFEGVRVYGTAPAGLEIGDFVLVTGVASCESPVNFDELTPVVRVDSESDIRILPAGG